MKFLLFFLSLFLTGAVNELPWSVTRWVWDGNTPLHEWTYDEKDRPKIITDEYGLKHKEGEEPTEDITTWVFEEGSFRPAAKLTKDKKYSIITDYLGAPAQMYDEKGQAVWEARLDIYGKVHTFAGRSLSDCPFRYQGQYEDAETGLYYNRFRYYDPESGTYISQDPIGLDGGINLYAYVHDPNSWVDVFGWVKGPASLDKQTGVYTIYNPSTGQVYVGSALDVGSRISDTNHTKAQELLKLEGTKVEFTLVDLGNAKDWQTQNRILRHFEQQEFLDAQRRFGTDNMLNSNNPEAVKKKARNQGIVDDKGASKGKKINCS